MSVADETNAGVTAFVAEVTSMCGLRWDGIAVVNSLDFILSSSVFRCCFTALLHFVPSPTMHSQAIVSMLTAFIYGMRTSL